jgi:hypothetical protein
MKIPIIPRLALRALNESRRLDPLAYLSLRYTLNTTCAVRNVWAQEIAPEIVRRRPGPMFLGNKQFKQLNEKGKPEFRDVVRPGGPESLAEVALLDACATAGGPFIQSDEVFSYRFPNHNSIDGAFVPYFQLFSTRQTAIGNACKKRPRDWVLYADIRRFYPSITFSRATKAWEMACAKSSLDVKWKELGSLLLKRQYSLKTGLLIGPLFSHLIANLVLKSVDLKMRKAHPGRYFRYVDDFAVVVQPRRKGETLARLRGILKPLGLKLHPKKIHWIGTKKWQDNAPYQLDEYVDQPIGDEGWKRFIDNLKCYLMARPEMQDTLKQSFLEAGLRVPLPRYTAAIMEKGYGTRFSSRLHSNDFTKKLKELNPKKLANEGRNLREHYADGFKFAWEEFVTAHGLIRRWKLSRVRYLSGRLTLIGSIEQVREAYSLIKGESEVAEYAAILLTLLTADADSLLPFGWKIAASVGQVLAAASITVTCSSTGWKTEHVEAYAALRLAGVTVEGKLPRRLNRIPRIQTVNGNISSTAWAEMPQTFYRELFTLIGGKNLEEHQMLLQTPADPDERWEVFADELLGMEPT